MARVDSTWEIFQSETGVYELYLPGKEHKSKTMTLRLSPDFVVHSESTSSQMDQRPFINVVKSHIVKLDQTWGTALSAQEIQSLLANEMKRYERHYLKKGALVINQSTAEGSNKLRMGDIEFVFNDDELGPQSARVRVYVNGQSKVQQILVGPDKLVGSKWSNDFFEYMNVKDGVSKRGGDIDEEWVSHTSDMQLFTMYAPPVVEPFVKDELKISKADDHESVKVSVFDPVRFKRMDYAVHGYKGGEVWTFAMAKKFLLNEFVAKHTKSPAGLTFERGLDGALAQLNVDFNVSTKTKRGVQKEHVRLRATFAQNYLLVQELKGARALTGSHLAQQLVGKTVFHPERAENAAKQ